ncbi:uncharacterized protein MONOS_8314 [Monocercomonoides exilis]|uniref:uncharacterized protein n=1 Tax=Monocercomonoides exilis TaxID=2049356 RepID=UPI00355A9068|nr:hypothetical protein MONOS_8314 [Monocercomonoides exilis]|eukprot:MONOS_8314.1-p1 / transcript=MONOS_8314.1 / gene=MONOS_8314 / organism=Monocercomonoides_exilis_PA203 / gene_product=unspecified product / transcript_product=unspecified product / location=Mono_scaffold00311:20928-23011(+) / protein_length=639 / sequence_SO=supercontig / SO=protein_coding / is_pseudo=false
MEALAKDKVDDSEEKIHRNSHSEIHQPLQSKVNKLANRNHAKSSDNVGSISDKSTFNYKAFSFAPFSQTSQHIETSRETSIILSSCWYSVDKMRNFRQNQSKCFIYTSSTQMTNEKVVMRDNPTRAKIDTVQTFEREKENLRLSYLSSSFFNHTGNSTEIEENSPCSTILPREMKSPMLMQHSDEPREKESIENEEYAEIIDIEVEVLKNEKQMINRQKEKMKDETAAEESKRFLLKKWSLSDLKERRSKEIKEYISDSNEKKSTLNAKRRKEIKKEILEAKEYMRLFGVWITKDWEIDKEEAEMWREAERKMKEEEMKIASNIELNKADYATLEELELIAQGVESCISGAEKTETILQMSKQELLDYINSNKKRLEKMWRKSKMSDEEKVAELVRKSEKIAKSRKIEKDPKRERPLQIRTFHDTICVGNTKKSKEASASGLSSKTHLEANHISKVFPEETSSNQLPLALQENSNIYLQTSKLQISASSPLAPFQEPQSFLLRSTRDSRLDFVSTQQQASTSNQGHILPIRYDYLSYPFISIESAIFSDLPQIGLKSAANYSVSSGTQQFFDHLPHINSQDEKMTSELDCVDTQMERINLDDAYKSKENENENMPSSKDKICCTISKGNFVNVEKEKW